VFNRNCRFGPLWTEILREDRIHTDLRDMCNNISQHSHDALCERLFANAIRCLQRCEVFPTARDRASAEAAVNAFPILQHICADVRRSRRSRRRTLHRFRLRKSPSTSWMS
jgi:hypothetical protein